MARELTHSELEELLGAYALDAVSTEEADSVEAHLRECPRCRAEVAEHREVAAALAHVGAPAPPGLWSRIAAGLEETPPKLDMARVTPMRPRTRSVPARVAAFVAAAAAAVIAVLGVQVAQQDDRIDSLASALEKRGLDEAVEAALFDETARKVDLRSPDGRTFAQAVVRSNGEAYLVRHNLPPLPEELTYQVWALLGDRPVSVGVLGADPGVAPFTMAADGVSMLAVTAEAAGGVPAPTKKPLVSGTLPVA